MKADRPADSPSLRTLLSIPALIATIFYAIGLFILAGHQPLWLDEILQLLTIDTNSTGELLRRVSLNTGGVPLGYLTQRAFLDLSGYSDVSARLPSIFFGILSSIGVLVLATSLGFEKRFAIVSGVTFALLPLTFRYTLEARPYSEALCFSVFSTIAFLALLRNPRWSRAAFYSLALVAGLYSQPYSFFVGAAHLVWSAAWLRGNLRKAILLKAGSAALVALLAFLPWLIFVNQQWKDQIAAHFKFTWSWSVPQMLMRELAGNYLITLVLLILIATAMSRTSRIERSAKALLFAGAIIPIVGALLGDAAAGYFFAVRQMIFALPFLALLLVEGLAILLARQRILAWALLGTLLAAALRQDFTWFVAPREDLREAAMAIRSKSAAAGACVQFVPPNSVPLYAFFAKELTGQTCKDPIGEANREDPLPGANRIVLAVPPASSNSGAEEAAAALRAKGFDAEDMGQTAGGTRVQVFSRKRPQSGALLPRTPQTGAPQSMTR